MQTLNDNPRISSLLYLVTAIESLVLLVAGVGLLLFPSVIRPLWPWPLSPFNALLLGAIYSASLVTTAIGNQSFSGADTASFSSLKSRW